MLDEILLPGFDVEFIVESKPIARRLHDVSGVNVVAGDPRRTDTYLKADLSPGTCIIVEDNGKRSIKKILDSVRDAGGTLVYVLGVGLGAKTRELRALAVLLPTSRFPGERCFGADSRDRPSPAVAGAFHLQPLPSSQRRAWQ